MDKQCAGNVANVNKVLSGPCPPRSSVVIESGPCRGVGGGEMGKEESRRAS